MFATSGFFRGVLCPENDAENRCKRPYCHFRHIRRVPSLQDTPAVKNAEERKGSSKPALESGSLPSHRRHKDRKPTAKPIRYVPTPLFLCKKPDPDSSSHDAEETGDPSGSAGDDLETDLRLNRSSYTPTPLAELEAMGAAGNDSCDRGDDDDNEKNILAGETIADDVDVDGDGLTVHHTSHEKGGGGGRGGGGLGRNLQSGMPESDSEDVIIETHSYGGVTITTKTPKSLCRQLSGGNEEDLEYDPFSSCMESKEEAGLDDHSSGVCDKPSYVPTKTSQVPGDFLDNQCDSYSPDPERDQNSYQFSTDDTEFDVQTTSFHSAGIPLFGEEEYQRNKYSPQYSHGDQSCSKLQLEYDPCSGFSAPHDMKRDLPTYSTSSNEPFPSGVDNEWEHDDIQSPSKADKRAWSKNDAESRKILKMKSRKADITKNLSNSKSKKEEKLVQKSENKQVMVKTSPSKEKTSVKRTTSREKNEMNQSSKSKKLQSEALSETKEKQSSNKHPQPMTDRKIMPESANKHAAITKEGAKSISLHDGGNVKSVSTPKTKVSSKQLEDFFQKRQKVKKEQQCVKANEKNCDNSDLVEISTVHSKKPRSNSVDSVEKQPSLNQTKAKNVVQKGKYPMSSKHKENAVRVEKTMKSDRSVFASIEKSQKRIVKKPSVRECNFDLFAIANDSDSEVEDDDDDKPKSRRPQSSKAPSGSSAGASAASKSIPLKAKQRMKEDTLAIKKRSASQGDLQAAKRLRTFSSSRSAEDSKLVELDLFGDDSDEAEEEVKVRNSNSRPDGQLKPKPKATIKSSVQKSNSLSIGSSKKPPSVKKEVKSTSSFSPVKNKGPHDSFIHKPNKAKSSGLGGSEQKRGKAPVGSNAAHLKKTSLPRRPSVDVRSPLKETKPFRTTLGKKIRGGVVSSSDEDDPDVLRDLPSDIDDDSDSEDDACESVGDDRDDLKRFLEDSSEEDTFDECLRIFQEDGQRLREQSKSHFVRSTSQTRNEDAETSAQSGKQRVAHKSKFGVRKRREQPKKAANARPSPAQMCYNRYQMMQERVRRSSQEEEASGGRQNPEGLSITGRKRIAHQPGTTNSTLQRLTMGSNPSNKTTAMSNAKSAKRVAHMPKSSSKRPMVVPDRSNKVPTNIRQRYLNVFIDEIVKTARTEKEAFEKGLEEEKVVYQRASSRNIYLNLCVNALKKLQNVTASQLDSPPSTPTLMSARNVISHEAVLGGKLAAKTSFSIHRSSHSQEKESFTGAQLYERLKPFILTETLLRENGYPRPSEVSGHVLIYKEEETKKVTSSDPNQQVCCRCGATFLRRPTGQYITKEPCTYHWGRLWTRRIAGVLESRFSCCSGDMEAKGCSSARLHVTEDKTSNLSGYMKTIPKSPPRNGHPGIYALDCEMCYTSKGLELTRVTIVDSDLEEVYDTLVKPDNEVVDYNTRFSGITEDDLKHVTTKLRGVQAVLLNLFSAHTILIGHSLESDLLALKLLHSTVVDTSVVFPHRRGPPFKRALKTLMAEFLKRLIQDDVGGHDSLEDAKSCMELMIWKVKEDAKVRKR
ncbi:uncharacterized protein [Diadema antillarum]|uniref:uncharacterized protein n=1 Tax=Diadema antillarum TaxID=105358 RepID=UPI003A880241